MKRFSGQIFPVVLWLMLIVLVFLCVFVAGNVIKSGSDLQRKAVSLQSQIDNICTTGQEMWYGEQAEKPGFEPIFSVSCTENPDKTRDVAFVRHTKNGEVKTTIKSGGTVVRNKK